MFGLHIAITEATCDIDRTHIEAESKLGSHLRGLPN